jgi:hypothetical protein
MDHILEKVVGKNMFSMIDGFFGYNQIVVHEDNKEKISFTTPWGTFMYYKMSYCLMNAGATFQRAMDLAFVGEEIIFLLFI